MGKGDPGRRIDSVLKRVCFDRDGNSRWQPVEERTPLDALMEEEPPVELQKIEVNGTLLHWPDDDDPVAIGLQALKLSEAAEIAAWARLRLMQWLFGDGPHPMKVSQRAFGLAWARYGELVGPMSGHDIAELHGQGKGGFSAQMRRWFGEPVEARLGEEMQIPGQKSKESRVKYAENARKNTPRRSLPRSEEERGETERRREGETERRSALLAAQKLEEERRYVEGAARTLDAMKNKQKPKATKATKKKNKP